MAGAYNPEGDILEQGINAMIRIDPDDPNGSNPQEVGFVETYSVRQNINIQRAECIGEFDAVSIDATGRSVTWNLSGFIPNKALITRGIDTVRGGGKVVIKNFVPDTDKLADTKVITKIPYIDLWDDKHKTIVGYSTWLVPSSQQDGGQGKGYVKSDITLECLTYNNGPDYESII